MTKLVAHMIPGLLLILTFAVLKSFVIPLEVTVQPWFQILTAAVFIFSIVIPCVIYYLRMPPGIDHK
ncbi:MAG: hypothetical protein J6U20_06285 [Fibrobacter sp.]|nr:hypothetical protein [Fibrobacter sp.]